MANFLKFVLCILEKSLKQTYYSLFFLSETRALRTIIREKGLCHDIAQNQILILQMIFRAVLLCGAKFCVRKLKKNKICDYSQNKDIEESWSTVFNYSCSRTSSNYSALHFRQILCRAE